MLRPSTNVSTAKIHFFLISKHCSIIFFTSSFAVPEYDNLRSKFSTSNWVDIYQPCGRCGALPKDCQQFGGESAVAVVNAGVHTILPLRARDSVWHVYPSELPSGFFVNDCSGELLSRFCGQTEWRGRCRLSRGGRCVSFSKRQAATINRITVGTEISEKPPPFRLATLHYRKILVFTNSTH